MKDKPLVIKPIMELINFSIMTQRGQIITNCVYGAVIGDLFQRNVGYKYFTWDNRIWVLSYKGYLISGFGLGAGSNGLHFPFNEKA